jgi:hypothetical protein
LCSEGPAPGCGGRLLDRADLGAGEFGVDEEPERVELLVLLHEAVQRGAAQPGQGDAGGVAQQARLDDLQGEGVIALADEGCGGGRELLVPAPGEQVEGGGVPATYLWGPTSTPGSWPRSRRAECQASPDPWASLRPIAISAHPARCLTERRRRRRGTWGPCRHADHAQFTLVLAGE